MVSGHIERDVCGFSLSPQEYFRSVVQSIGQIYFLAQRALSTRSVAELPVDKRTGDFLIDVFGLGLSLPIASEASVGKDNAWEMCISRNSDNTVEHVVINVKTGEEQISITRTQERTTTGLINSTSVEVHTVDPKMGKYKLRAEFLFNEKTGISYLCFSDNYPDINSRIFGERHVDGQFTADGEVILSVVGYPL